MHHVPATNPDVIREISPTKYAQDERGFPGAST